MNLSLPGLTKRGLLTPLRRLFLVPHRLDEIWALDFMVDALYGGRVFGTLNVIDEGNREVLGIEIVTSILSLRMIWVMERLIEIHCEPRARRFYNGSELTSTAITEWCHQQQIELRLIQLGKPNQNAFVERFNKTYRKGLLDAYLLDSLDQVREITQSWLRECNEGSPKTASVGCRP